MNESFNISAIGDFNSRPHRGRLVHAVSNVWIVTFQLTPSQRATSIPNSSLSNSSISTHALTEGDRYIDILTLFWTFQLTPSQRATSKFSPSLIRILFQLTPSQRATFNVSEDWLRTGISTHALTEGDVDDQSFSDQP